MTNRDGNAWRCEFAFHAALYKKSAVTACQSNNIVITISGRKQNINGTIENTRGIGRKAKGHKP